MRDAIRRCRQVGRAMLLPPLLALLLAAVFLPACQSPGQADPATVAVTSEPPGAKVYVDGYHKGVTPCTVVVTSVTAEPRRYRFTLLKPGYQRFEASLSLSAGLRRDLPTHLRKAVGLSGRVICLDPGHPSETSPGTRGPTGVTENHINWVIALKLKQALADYGAQVVMTKQAENELVTNRRRAEIANSAQADIMLRLHCDAAQASGFMLFYPDRAGTVDGVTGPPPEVRSASRTAADAMERGMKGPLTGHLRARGVRGDSATYIGSRQGALTGSIFSKVPVVTVEMCVLTNAADERFIASEQGQRLMVRALVEGLQLYFSERESDEDCCPEIVPPPD